MSFLAFMDFFALLSIKVLSEALFIFAHISSNFVPNSLSISEITCLVGYMEDV